MRIFQPLLSGLLVLATAGCSLLQSESPRFTLASDEGKYVYTDPSTLPKEQIFQAADQWITEHFNAFATKIEQRDSLTGRFILHGRGPVNYYGHEKQCSYVLTVSAGDNNLRLEFETRDLENGYAPNPSHLQQMESRYQSIRTGILTRLKTLENAVPPSAKK